MSTPNQKTCEHCEKILHGRSDQRFCNDTCRNSFNRLKRQAERTPLPGNANEIWQVIKNNYQLLAHKKPTEYNEYYIGERDDYVARGFNPNFFTSFHKDENGTMWYCVFDWCFTNGDTEFLIKDFPEKIEL